MLKLNVLSKNIKKIFLFEIKNILNHKLQRCYNFSTVSNNKNKEYNNTSKEYIYDKTKDDNKENKSANEKNTNTQEKLNLFDVNTNKKNPFQTENTNNKTKENNFTELNREIELLKNLIKENYNSKISFREYKKISNEYKEKLNKEFLVKKNK